jgi:hypothetical protein
MSELRNFIEAEELLNELRKISPYQPTPEYLRVDGSNGQP